MQNNIFTDYQDALIHNGLQQNFQVGIRSGTDRLKSSNSTSRPAGMALGDTAVYCTRKEIPHAFEATLINQTYNRSKIYNTNETVATRAC